MCYSKNSSEWKVSGIVSFGPDTECGSGLPGVYTKVAYFKDWINQVLDFHEKRSTTESEAISETLPFRRSRQNDNHYRHNCDKEEDTTIPEENSSHRLETRLIYILLYSLGILEHRKYISYWCL